MNMIHRQLRTSPPRGWRAVVAVAALGAATVVAGGVAAGGPGDVQLEGPTGSRLGVRIRDAASAPDPSTLEPLDTFGRDPFLRLYAADTGATWSAWQVAAVSIEAPDGSPQVLARGVAEAPIELVEIDAPAPGDWLVVATLTTPDGAGPGSWAWRLIVPDRSLPETPPAPDVVLFGGGRTALAERGSGCFLGTCGDIGGLPPDRALPRIHLDRADEPIAVTLSDGGRMARIRAVATSLDVDGAGPVVLLDQDLAPGRNVVLVPPPPAAGRWRLELQIGHADGRGSQAAYARVSVPGP